MISYRQQKNNTVKRKGYQHFVGIDGRRKNGDILAKSQIGTDN
jgi:hypothetical protein